MPGDDSAGSARSLPVALLFASSLGLGLVRIFISNKRHAATRDAFVTYRFLLGSVRASCRHAGTGRLRSLFAARRRDAENEK